MNGMVLLADDDRAVRTVLSQALTRAGFRVRSTGVASTLWRWIEEGEGDVVVTDVMMPDGDALELLPTIRRKRPELPVIVMSAQNTVMTAIRSAQAGAYEYLPKPFDLREVISHVNRALSTSEKAATADAGRGRRPAGRTVASHRPLAGDAGSLPHHGAADAHRPDGDDRRRIRHRQGAGRPRAA